MKPFGILIITLSALFPMFQLFQLPDIADKLALFSQGLGLMALVLMAWGQIMATRILGLETIFGGLDRIYVLHKWSGIVAMAAILLHDTIDADMDGLGPDTPIGDLAETLGEISLYGLLVLVVLSIATFVPYHLWKWTHKLMGLLFAAGAFHFFFIMKPFSMSDPAGLYTGTFCLAGLLAYFWTLRPVWLQSTASYEIRNVSKTGGALSIEMTPTGKALAPRPGQFGVFSFAGSEMSEPHPFSFSKIGQDGSLRISIKPLGDFTQKLTARVQPNQKVGIAGPYGRFNLSQKSPQVWIAAGIGITPFLAWTEALEPDAPAVDLFYCAPSPEMAPHLDEVVAAAAEKPNLTLHLIYSNEGNRLTADIISEKSGDLDGKKVSFCGPVKMRRALQAGLGRFGVTTRNFHYEEFEFRTGIGLKRLASWVLDRRTARS